MKMDNLDERSLNEYFSNTGIVYVGMEKGFELFSESNADTFFGYVLKNVLPRVIIYNPSFTADEDAYTSGDDADEK